MNISLDLGKKWKLISLPDVKDITKIPFDMDEENNILYININNTIYSLKNDNWIEIINNDDIINDFKYINHFIIYTTDNSINIYDIKTNENKKIEKNIIIKKLIKYGQAYMYAISDEGNLFEIKKVSDKNDWIISSLKTNVNGLITDILHIDKNTWYYSAVSQTKWVKLRKGE